MCDVVHKRAQQLPAALYLAQLVFLHMLETVLPSDPEERKDKSLKQVRR